MHRFLAFIVFLKQTSRGVSKEGELARGESGKGRGRKSAPHAPTGRQRVVTAVDGLHERRVFRVAFRPKRDEAPLHGLELVVDLVVAVPGSLGLLRRRGGTLASLPGTAIASSYSAAAAAAVIATRTSAVVGDVCPVYDAVVARGKVIGLARLLPRGSA
jgi:hypothetical protein